MNGEKKKLVIFDLDGSHHSGTDMPVFGPCGQEDRVQPGAEVPVDLGQLEFPVEVRAAPDALHQGAGPMLPGEVYIFLSLISRCLLWMDTV